MKTNYRIVSHISVIIVCVILAGCLSRRTVTPLGGSYEEVTRTWTSMSEPEATQISLQYRKPSGWKITIWPSVDGYIVNSNTAIFVGLMGNHESKLFAVKSPDIPMDITSEVLWRQSKQSDRDFEKLLSRASVVYEKEKGNTVEFHFVDGSHKDIIFTLDWTQISDVMHEVKEKGVVKKDRVWGTSYIEKEFKSDEQK